MWKNVMLASTIKITEQPAGKLMPNSISEKAWIYIPADCHKPLSSPSILSLFFSFSFTFIFYL